MTLAGCMCLAISAQAQLKKGTQYLGATISFDGTSMTPDVINGKPESISNSLSLNPSIQGGKFLQDNRLIGIGIGGPIYMAWGRNSLSDGSTSKYHAIQGAYTLSPFIRQYKSFNDKWAAFITGAVDLAYLKASEKDRNGKESWDGFSAGLRIVPGVSYWITPRLALETDINLLSLGAGYKSFVDIKSFSFSSAVTTGLTSYFSVRASWYIQKP